MADIRLDSELLKRIEQIATQRSVTIDQFLNEAIHTFLRQVELQEMQVNIQAFENQQELFQQTYKDQYIAIHTGQLVDHDPDFQTLHHRIRQRYGSEPVLIRSTSPNEHRYCSTLFMRH